MSATAAPATAPAQGLSREAKLIVFVAVMASLLEIIDSSIVNVALQTIMGNLGATLEDVSMVVTGYAIANAIVLPLSAWLGERFGRRPYYLGCILAFIATSVACGLAPNLPTLVVCRILQGLAGGALLPTSQTLIYEQFPKEKAGMAGAIFGMSVMIGPTLGPTLGGYLTDNFGWRSIFNINLPLGIFAFFIGLLVIKNVDRPAAPAPLLAEGEIAPAKPVKEKKPGIDGVGLGLLTAGIGCMQYVLERGQADDWWDSRAIVTCAIIAAVSLPTFVWWELRVKNPIINIRLFKDPIVVNGVLLMGSVGFFLYSAVFILPIFAARVLHYDATQTGMLFIPGSLLTALMMPVVGKSMQKIDPRILVGVGLVGVEVCAMMMAHFSSMSDKGEILNALYVRGFAMAFLFVPINSSILSQFKGINMGQVSGLMNLSRQVGGSAGIAMVDTLLDKASRQNYQDLIGRVSLLEPQTRIAMMQAKAGMGSKMLQYMGSATANDGALRSIYGRLQAQVFMMSISQLLYTVAIVFAFSFIPLMRLRLRYRPGAPITDAH